MISAPLYDGHGWTIRLEEAVLPDGRRKTVARAKSCDTVHILAFPRPKTVVVLREYRPHYGKWVWMLPSGKVDKETDVDAAAQRELREETGYQAANIKKYCVCRHTERVDYACHLYIATDLTKAPLPQDAAEMIEVHELPFNEALDNMLSCDGTVHTVSAFGLLRYMRECG